MLLAVMIDAFAPQYLEFEPPFLTALRKDGLAFETIPSFGFEPDAAYTAGLYPEQCDGGMHYWRSPETSVFRWTKPFKPLFAKVPGKLQPYLRKGIQAANYFREKDLARRLFARPAWIPFEYLHLFDVSHPKLMFQPGFTSSPTLFDLVTEKGGKFRYLGYPLQRGGIEATYPALEKADLKGVDLVFMLVGNLDETGHAYGPHSPEIREEVMNVDRWLEKMVEHLRKHDPDLKIVIFGDHGMVEVDGTVDVSAALEPLPYTLGVHYDMFLDSTFARFWFHDQEAEKAVRKTLEELDGGTLFSDQDRELYKARYPHNRFGDLIFWVDEGKIVLPNYFQQRPGIRGMHGYRREVPGNHSSAIIYDGIHRQDRSSLEQVEMVRLFPTFLDLLGIKECPVEGVESLLAGK